MSLLTFWFYEKVHAIYAKIIEITSFFDSEAVIRISEELESITQGQFVIASSSRLNLLNNVLVKSNIFYRRFD